MMKKAEAFMGAVFRCGAHDWVVTDIGTRTVIAIKATEGWMAGPPYALDETVFDEDDLLACKMMSVRATHGG